METIFYKQTDDENNPDSWLNKKPYKIWFNIKDALYEPNGNIEKLFITEQNFVKNISLTTKDYFSDSGIIRKIYVYISCQKR